jgi:hypothetical protein
MVGGAIILPNCPDGVCVERAKDMQQASPFPAGSIIFTSGATPVVMTWST